MVTTADFRSSFEHNTIIQVIVQAANIVLSNIYGSTNALLLGQDEIKHIIERALADDTSDLTQVVNNATRVLTSAIDRSQVSIENDASNNTTNIINTLSFAVADSTAVNRETVIAVRDELQDDIAGVESTVASLETSLVAEVATSNSMLDTILNVLGDGIDVVINNDINISGSIFSELIGKVGDLLSSNNTAVNKTVSIMGEITKGVLEVAIQGMIAQQLVGNVELVAIAEAILTNKAKRAKAIDDTFSEEDDSLTNIVYRTISKALGEDFHVTADDLRIGSREILFSTEGNSSQLTCEADGILQVRPMEGIAGKWFDILSGLIMAMMWPLGVAQQKTERCLAVFSEDNPWKMLEPGDVIRMRNLGLLDDNQVIKIIKRNGFSHADAILLINSGQTLPSVDWILTMWLRDIFDDKGVDFALNQLGYSDVYIDGIKDIAFFIPPVQDLVTMAVREVFNIEQATRFGQFAEFPEDFAENAKKQGVSRIWAERYWAAHWVLPSIQMGYEMLHRGVITQPELEELMKVLDVMPVWRSRLIEISYAPFTRVDIRRMNAVGVLSEAEVKSAYKDIGYNEEKANKLTQFTIELNKEDELITLNITEDLTRSNIVGFYVDGIIERTTAFLFLTQAGINIAAAELFLMDADFRMERRQRRQAIDLVLDGFRFGGKTYIETNDSLSGLGLATQELELVRFDLVRLQEQQTSLPSRADLDRFIKAELIDTTEYMGQMNRLGYSDVWAGRYMSLVTGGGG